MNSWIPVAFASVVLGLAVGFSLEFPPVDQGTASAVAASPVRSAAQRPDPYTIYLVDDAEEAESVREWLLYGETLVVTPENEELVVDAIEYIGGIQQAAGVDIQIVDFRG